MAPLAGEPLPYRQSAWLVGLIMEGLLLTVWSGWVNILEASLLAAVALVASRALTAHEARQAVDLNVLVVIAGTFGIGAAVSASGLAEHIARFLIDILGQLGDVGYLIGILLVTALLTELITNNAAAVLMFPIAITTAQQVGLNPRAFAIVVALGASAPFLTPIGYQPNTMVYANGRVSIR